MSALSPNEDMCGATGDVRDGAEADMVLQACANKAVSDQSISLTV